MNAVRAGEDVDRIPLGNTDVSGEHFDAGLAGDGLGGKQCPAQEHPAGGGAGDEKDEGDDQQNRRRRAAFEEVVGLDDPCEIALDGQALGLLDEHAHQRG